MSSPLEEYTFSELLDSACDDEDDDSSLELLDSSCDEDEDSSLELLDLAEELDNNS